MNAKTITETESIDLLAVCQYWQKSIDYMEQVCPKHDQSPTVQRQRAALATFRCKYNLPTPAPEPMPVNIIREPGQDFRLHEPGEPCDSHDTEDINDRNPMRGS